MSDRFHFYDLGFLLSIWPCIQRNYARPGMGGMQEHLHHIVTVHVLRVLAPREREREKREMEGG